MTGSRAETSRLGDIETPWGTLRRTTREGQPVWKLRCPQCGHWGDIDDDQLHGRISLDHTNCGATYEPSECQCTWHETHDYAKWIEGDLAVQIWKRRSDVEFMARLRQRVAEDKAILDRLGPEASR